MHQIVQILKVAKHKPLYAIRAKMALDKKDRVCREYALEEADGFFHAD